MKRTDYTHKWEPIQDLPADHRRWACKELPHLLDIWREQRLQLAGGNALAEFNARMNRRWAIETGVLENLYRLDMGVTVLLVEHGFDAALISHGSTDRPPEEVIGIVSAHQASLEGLFHFVKGERVFTKNYVCELHQQLLSKQRTVTAMDSQGNIVERVLLKGRFKSLPNNPYLPGSGLHEYCPPVQTDSQMDEMVRMHLDHEAAGVPAEITSAWLHHAFTQIHPFEDGNGRVARALASLVFIKGGLFPLLVTRNERETYMQCLSDADQGDLGPLVSLFSGIQRMSLIRALSISRDVLSSQATEKSVIESAAEMIFIRRQKQLRERQKKVAQTADRILENVAARLSRTAESVKNSLKDADPGYRVMVDSCEVGGDRSHYFKKEIIEAARFHDYYADIHEGAGWTRLQIRSPDGSAVNIVFSVHGVGRSVGVMNCVAFVQISFGKAGRSKAEPETDTCQRVMEDPFQFTCQSSMEDLREPLAGWLDEALLVALEQWRKSL